jgi:hypothetical protein
MKKQGKEKEERQDGTKNRRKTSKKGKEVNNKGRRGKFFPVRAMKAYGGSRGIAPPIIHLGTRSR